MGFTQPDTPPSEPAQMPQATTPGPAPVPYGGPDQSPEPPEYGVPAVSSGMAPDAGVMIGVTGNALQESGYAHDVSAGLVAPYSPGSPQPIYTCADDLPICRDDVSGTVAGAVDNALARVAAHEQSALPQGSALGMPMAFPDSPLDPGAGPGLTLPSGGFYDPPRDYGD